MKPYFKTVTLISLASAHLIAAPASQITNPDFTQGDPIPERANQDWTLGATGARGWIYSHRMETTQARQIYVNNVDKQSPADGVLEAGDVILGVADKAFSYDPRTELGKALTAAESNAGKGELSLIRWRKGKQENVVVKLPVLGSYSPTAPYNCPKSARILKQGCESLAQKISQPRYKANPVTRSLNALALLASGDPQYLPLVKKEAAWASDYSAQRMASWYYGYVIMLLSEYHMATGDDSVLPGLRRLSLEASNGQSIVGSWGHKFAGSDGRLLGYGMMNAPGVPLTTSLVLARKAGVNAPEVDLAIDRSLKLLRFYTGKGSIPYGDHAPWIQTHDDNGKNGMAAVLFSLLGETQPTKYFSKMSLACHGNERDTGHTGNFWNMTWAMPGVVQSGPQATGAWMHEFGAWYYDLARRWDGTFPHQGPPQMKGDSTRSWDSTGAYLIAYAMPLKNIMLTGKQPSAAPALSIKEAQSIIIDGRGWTNNNRYHAYDQLSMPHLFERLTSWSPVVRERAAIAITRRKGEPSPVPALMKMLDLPSVEARCGACQALVHLRGKAAPAVPALRKNLQHEDLWLRIQAAKALASIGDAAMVALPELLTKLAEGATEKDPRAMEQRYLSSALFSSRGGMLSRSLDGVDRDMLFKAVLAGLQNQDGRARGAFSSIYNQLSYDELKPILPAIYEAAKTPSPSGIMFCDQIRMAGLELLAKNHVSEGIELTAQYVKIMKPHASEKRIHKVLAFLKQYGAHAQKTIPLLEDAANYFEKDENRTNGFPARLGKQKAQNVRDAIKEIKALKTRPTLKSIKTSS
ncbi:MAG: acetylesterase [Verrucomicrobiae bacterium]|nr:acetylesterase [Verrucomicrobiae bacterium]NNJ43376.1 acetylesterase [Akkermansiaceae bacterium]